MSRGPAEVGEGKPLGEREGEENEEGERGQWSGPSVYDGAGRCGSALCYDLYMIDLLIRRLCSPDVTAHPPASAGKRKEHWPKCVGVRTMPSMVAPAFCLLSPSHTAKRDTLTGRIDYILAESAHLHTRKLRLSGPSLTQRANDRDHVDAPPLSTVGLGGSVKVGEQGDQH